MKLIPALAVTAVLAAVPASMGVAALAIDNAAAPSTHRVAARHHTEPGDDHGSHAAEPGDDNGGDTPRDQRTEPGDDHGSHAAEPGDDNGGDRRGGSDDSGHHGGDDKGGDDD
jgi:hypothetical protein